MKPKAVLAYCREKGIRSFDLRYTDLSGEWRHVTFPIASLEETAFENGFGQEVILAPNALTHPFAVLLPDSEANFLDPHAEHPTLVLVSSVQDVVRRQEDPLDSRYVLSQALRYLQSTSIADDARVQITLRYWNPGGQRGAAFTGETPVPRGGDGPRTGHDDQYELRCEIANRGIDAGLPIDRHQRSANGASQIAMKSTSIVETCDNAMMLRYLTASANDPLHSEIAIAKCWSTTQWSMIRNNEPIFSDGTYHGLSEIGLYAQGGLLKHAATLSGIYLLSQASLREIPYPFENDFRPENPRSFCRESRNPAAPREIVLEVRSIPTVANTYLAYAATLMAMIDGVQNKIVPPNDPSQSGYPPLSDDLHRWLREESCKGLESDWDFLYRGDVFSEELIHWLRAQVRGDE